MRVMRLSLASFVVLLGCSSEREPRDAAEWRPFAGALADTRSRVITSRITGRDYEISVALPRGYDGSAETYPVLYAVDANGEFGTVVEAARLMRYEETIPQLVIVGIGYPVGRFFDASAPRSVDLTPSQDQAWERQSAAEFPDWPAPEGSGGAPGFLEFLRDELVPLVESEFRVDPNDRALYGHSFGGLFALYALLEGEGTYRRFIAGSPSLWWDDGVMFEMEQRYSEENSALSAKLFLSVGMLEAADGEEYAMVSNVEELESILDAREYAGLDFQTVYFEDENHTSVIPATVARGLRVIFREGA